MMPRRLSVTFTTPPANGQNVLVICSTKGLSLGTTASIADNGAAFIPGPFRKRWAGARLRYSVLCTAQNVTGREQVMTANNGVEADFEDHGATGNYTVTAGTTATRIWEPTTPDWRLRFDAGATGPTLFTVQLVVTWGENT